MGQSFKKYCLNVSKLYRSLLHQYVLDPVDKEVNYLSKNNHGRSKTFSCGPPMFKHWRFSQCRGPPQNPVGRKIMDVLTERSFQLEICCGGSPNTRWPKRNFPKFIYVVARGNKQEQWGVLNIERKLLHTWPASILLPATIKLKWLTGKAYIRECTHPCSATAPSQPESSISSWCLSPG